MRNLLNWKNIMLESIYQDIVTSLRILKFVLPVTERLTNSCAHRKYIEYS